MTQTACEAIKDSLKITRTKRLHFHRSQTRKAALNEHTMHPHLFYEISRGSVKMKKQFIVLFGMKMGHYEGRVKELN